MSTQASTSEQSVSNGPLPQGIMPEHRKTPNPQTPKLYPHPADSPVVKAIVDADHEYKRAHLKNVMDAEQWKLISIFGEVDYDGDPNRQAMAALHIYIECCHARKVDRVNDPIIVMAEKAEWERFNHFSHKAKFGLE